MSLLSAADLQRLLTELGDELDARGVRGDMFIVGGAAMALAYNTRRATRDLDAVFEPKTTVYEAAARVGERHGLPDTCVNDAVKGFLLEMTPPLRCCSTIPGYGYAWPRRATCSL